jgi:hypothetical protein
MVTLCFIALGVALNHPRRILTFLSGSRVAAHVDFCTTTIIGGGRSGGLVDATSCVGSWRMPDGRRGSGPLDGVGHHRAFDGNIPPEPLNTPEGSEVRVYATTSYAVKPNPGIVMSAGLWLLACWNLVILLGLQLLRRVLRQNTPAR